MSHKMILDRIPYQFCEGPFWGNGKMGAVLYVRDEKLCISIDHVGLWELRETLPDEPRATFAEILQKKDAYLCGDPALVADTNIFDENIGRTRLPSLAVSLELPGKITGFFSETDVERAETFLRLELDGRRELCGRIWLDSCVNVLALEFKELEEAEQSRRNDRLGDIRVKALGWDLESPRLKPLKNWSYLPCSQTEENDTFTVLQQYGGDSAAVLSGKKERNSSGFRMAVNIESAKEEQQLLLADAGRQLVSDYLEKQDTYYRNHLADWKKFWNGFGLQVPNDRVQEAFEQEMYKLYCNEREDSMPITLQGVWNPDNRMPAWFGDLHNDLNVQSCYWPAYKTGNVRLVRPYVDYYTRAIPRFTERARKLFGVEDAVHLPTMMTPEGTGAASEWCYWNTLLGAELFASVDFTWFYEYSRELDTLRDQIYPFIEKVIHLYQGIAYEGEDGYWHIPFTESPEVDRDGRMLMLDDATFTLSTLHYLCRKMAGYAELIGKDGKEFLTWEKKLAPVVPNETGYPVFPGVNVFHSHRHFCQMYPIYPLCEEAHNDVANASLDTAVNQGFLEFASFSFPYLGIFAARCGRGNMCRTMLELYCMVFRSRNSFTVNGDVYQNGVLRVSDTSAGESADAFTLESGFFVPTLLCEMFAHRAKDDIWLMAGIPDEWKNCSCRGFTVEGGHSFDLERKDYRISRIVLHANCDETVTLHWKRENSGGTCAGDGAELPGVFRKGILAQVVVEQLTDTEYTAVINIHAGEEWIFEL